MARQEEEQQGAVGGEEAAAAVEEFLSELEEHRRACERSGNYVEAEVAKHRLQELKAHEEVRRKESLRAQQAAERAVLEDSHRAEFERVQALWESRLAEYAIKATELARAMDYRQNEDRCAALAARQPGRVAGRRRSGSITVGSGGPNSMQGVGSAKVAQLRRVQETLAKRMEYAEAHRVKCQADRLEALELEKMLAVQQEQMDVVEEKLLNRQRQEQQVLSMRIESGREEIRRQRQLDLERVLLRYQHARLSLDKHQARQRTHLEKDVRRLGVPHQSLFQPRSTASSRVSSASIRSKAESLQHAPASDRAEWLVGDYVSVSARRASDCMPYTSTKSSYATMAIRVPSGR